MGTLLQACEKKIYQMLYWEIERAKFKGYKKAEFPSKPQFAFTATIVVTEDVMTMFVGLVVLELPLSSKDISFLISSLSSCQHCPLLDSKLSRDVDASQNKYLSSPTSLITTAQIKLLLMESTQVTAGHCQHIV